MIVEFLKEAERGLVEAVLWYESKETGVLHFALSKVMQNL